MARIHFAPTIMVIALLTSGLPSTDAAPPNSEPLINAAAEQKVLNLRLPDGGLPPVVGVQNIQVYRASRPEPALTDGKGWTYNHHVDLAQWKGRMYLAWTNGEKDEDVWPARELYVTSEDGYTWSKPAELFPQGISASLRMYFFHAPNGHMLAIAGMRMGTEELVEAKKGGAVVREVLPDHKLGPVFTLIAGPRKPDTPMPMFDTSPEKGFVEACRQLLGNRPFLEQQDHGNLLGKERMAAHTNAHPYFGKAFCFYHRKDGALVGVAKSAWTVVSTDEGKTWSKPVRPATIVTGGAKEWVQRTSDDQFALVLNPALKERFPLVLLVGEDGIAFNHMRTVHGEVPMQRYDGRYKGLGPQYVRGISEWARDGTQVAGAGAKDLWIAYSVNKEDIWVSRIPVPVRLAETGPVKDSFSELAIGGCVPGWNTYSPKWGGVAIADAGEGTKALVLEDRDPYDYAKAERVFHDTPKPTVKLKLMVREMAANATLEIDLRSAMGNSRPVRIAITSDGKVQAIGRAATDLGVFAPRRWMDLSLAVDAAAGTFTANVDGKGTPKIAFAEPAKSLARLTLRTGSARGVGEAFFAPAGSDRPQPTSAFLVKDVAIGGPTAD